MKTLNQERLATSLRRKCLQKFLYYFKKGYNDPKYISWERDYKEQAHIQFKKTLGKQKFRKLLKEGNYRLIADSVTRIESRTNLLFSFEKMALRDAVKSEEGARSFSEGLYQFLYGKRDPQARFNDYIKVIEGLPRKQTRVLTWPLVTVFAFLADPAKHIFLKPKVTKKAAILYGFPFKYHSRPNWETYSSLLNFAEVIRKDTKIYQPRDFIDLQSFIWVMGSEEYPW